MTDSTTHGEAARVGQNPSLLTRLWDLRWALVAGAAVLTVLSWLDGASPWRVALSILAMLLALALFEDRDLA